MKLELEIAEEDFLDVVTMLIETLELEKERLEEVLGNPEHYKNKDQFGEAFELAKWDLPRTNSLIDQLKCVLQG